MTELPSEHSPTGDPGTVPVVDAQVHTYERNHIERPWMGSSMPGGPEEVTGQHVVATMDSLNVDGALLVSTYSTYRFDPSYVIEVRNAYPDRFAMVTPVDPDREDISEVIAEWARTPGAVGVRVVLSNSHDVQLPTRSANDTGLRRTFTAAEKYNLPVCLACSGDLPLAFDVAARHSDTQFVVDHMGLHQPVEPPRPADPFADLPSLLALARLQNVAVKITGAATLSHEPFPFADLQGPLSRIFEAFGVERCMWGTDWTRATSLVSCAEATAAFLEAKWLSTGERAALMGGTLGHVFRWQPATIRPRS
jgi:L-fuconolactonase